MRFRQSVADSADFFNNPVTRQRTFITLRRRSLLQLRCRLGAIGLAKDRTHASLTGLLTTCLDARQRAAVEAVCTDLTGLSSFLHFRSASLTP